MKQKHLGEWWRSVGRRYNGMGVVIGLLVGTGGVALLLGLILPVGKEVALLIGGTLVGAGFSALVATETGRQAIHEQYAKEANLLRKRDIYEPLFSEVRILRERFDEAQKGRSPFPQAIALYDDKQSQAISQGRYPILKLEAWLQFQRDFRRDNFSPETQQELVELHRLAGNYNTALNALRESTNGVLVKHINQAKDILIQSEAFQEWVKANSVNGSYRIEGPRLGNPAHHWFQLVAETLTMPQDRFGLIFADAWLRNDDRPYFSTATVGWLLANKPGQAAADINKEPEISSRRFDSVWLQSIFQASLGELQNHPAYYAAWEVEKKLWTSLRNTETKLEKALRDIRDKYEGGEPPL